MSQAVGENTRIRGRAGLAAIREAVSNKAEVGRALDMVAEVKVIEARVSEA